MKYYGAKDLADSFRTVRNNTLIIAKEIPEARNDFRDLLRRPSKQLVQSRKQKLDDRRPVRLSAAED